MTTQKRGPGALGIVAYIYIFLPVFLFLVLWLKLYIGIPLGLLLIWFVYRALKSARPVLSINRNRKTMMIIAAAALIALVWVLLAGTGEVLAQYDDNSVRNGLLRLLIDDPWPVTRSMTYHGVIQQRGLVYYLGFILPAALFGKAFSLQAAQIFLILWCSLGIFLAWYFTCDSRGRLRLWYFPVLIFFSGLGVLGYYLFGGVYGAEGVRYEWWAEIFRFASPSSLICAAYNQFIPAWLLYLLIMRQKENKYIILLWSGSLIMCTFPAVGMLPFVAYKMIDNMRASQADTEQSKTKSEPETKKVNEGKKRILSFVSVANLLGVVIALICTAFLFTGNPAGNIIHRSTSVVPEARNTVMASGDNTGGLIIEEGEEPQERELPRYGLIDVEHAGRFLRYLIFIVIEAGIIYAIIFKAKKKDPLFYISLGTLILCPFIRVGDGIDFCMRASIPALFCMCQLSIDAGRIYKATKKYLLLLLLAVCLYFGVWRGVDMLRVPIEMTLEIRAQGIERPVQAWSSDKLLTSNYYSCNTEGKIFYEYLAR